MKKPKVFFVMVLFSFSIVNNAQNTLTMSANLMQPGDSITKERVAYVYAGEIGQNVVWDVSNLEKEDTYYIKYDTISQSRWIGYDTQKTYYYHVANNSLQMEGYESPLLSMDYKQPMLSLKFPLQFNQTYISEYLGEGRYCGTHYERIFGFVKITADSQGTLILSEKDTLPNTLRVYTINTSAIRMNRDSCHNDVDNLKQIITEHYQWYVRGYRYPVFETITSSTYDNMNHIATQQLAYRCPPEIQIALNDSTNERIRLEQQPLTDNNESEYDNEYQHLGSSDAGFTYDVKANGNQITITYELENTAVIRVLMVDVTGTVLRDIQQTNNPGSGYMMSIDSTGIRRGQYIIYINVNGTIYNTKIGYVN